MINMSALENIPKLAQPILEYSIGAIYKFGRSILFRLFYWSINTSGILCLFNFLTLVAEDGNYN